MTRFVSDIACMCHITRKTAIVILILAKLEDLVKASILDIHDPRGTTAVAFTAWPGCFARVIHSIVRHLIELILLMLENTGKYSSSG